jgi:hypothetical protein
MSDDPRDFDTYEAWRARPKTPYALRKQFGTWKAILGYADWELDELRRDILSGKIEWQFDEEFLQYLKEMI